jgi:hypothetical protein
LGLLPFAFGFLLWKGLGAWFFCFGLFGVESFWEGKELLKEKDRKSAPRTLT